jgi:hypothetical protein
MCTKYSPRFGLALLLVAALTVWCAPAQATTFTFGDEYFLGQNTNYSPTFSGVSGKTPNTSHGYFYQQEYTGQTPVQMGYTSLSGEYVFNTNQMLRLFGWAANGSNPVVSVFNLNNPINGTNTYFQYTVGGATTSFLFNGFDLYSRINLSFTLQGWLGGVLVDQDIITLTGNSTNTYTHFTENWGNVDTIEIVSTTGLPLNWGSGTLYMDNVEINDPVTTPEPASMLLLGSGALGLLGLKRRPRKA